jgi:hypothetical protein
VPALAPVSKGANVSVIKRTITKHANQPLAQPKQTEAEGYARFFNVAFRTLMPETFNTLCIRSGIDCIKEKPKASEHGPCWECRFLDGNHCHKWAADVPMYAQIDGCAEHKAMAYTERFEAPKKIEMEKLTKPEDICPF